jgi:hypothetical protein
MDAPEKNLSTSQLMWLELSQFSKFKCNQFENILNTATANGILRDHGSSYL